jgi:predicted ATPase
VLAQVSDVPEDEVVDGIDEAVRHRVILEVPGVTDRYTFAHALIRETLYKELTTSRRLRLHRRIGLVLEGLRDDHSDAHLGELAYHFTEAAGLGDAEQAIAYSTRAAQRAMSQLAYEEAVRLYEMALQALEGSERPSAGELAPVLTALHAAQQAAGDDDAAAATWARLHASDGGAG